LINNSSSSSQISVYHVQIKSELKTTETTNYKPVPDQLPRLHRDPEHGVAVAYLALSLPTRYFLPPLLLVS
jgi:hypothetical protein